MENKLLELSIEDALKCTYNKESNCRTFRNKQFTHLALCGFIKTMDIFGNFATITLTDGKHSLQLKVFLENQSKSIRAYLDKNVKDIEEKLNAITFTSDNIDFMGNEAFELEVLRFKRTYDSLAYVENVKLGDLLLISGDCALKQGAFKFTHSKAVRIMENKEEYLNKWMERVKRWSNT